MDFKVLITIIVIVVLLLILALFPEARALVRAFFRLFVKDMSTTPEGAEAIFEEKIDEARESYSKADDAYKKAVGKLSSAKRELNNLEERLKRVEAECESLVKNGKMESARLKVEEREEILSDIRRYNELIKAFTQATETAKEAQQLCEENLRKLKRESKETVENMKVKKALAEVYDDMNELKASTGTDKLLEYVRDKNKDLNEIVEGSKAVHDNKMSTRLKKAEAEAKQVQSNDYLDSLMKKYNK